MTLSLSLSLSAGDTVDDYHIPYQGLVPNDPSFEEMKRLVCDQAARPPVKLRWQQAWAPVINLMREGWNGNPKVRPTADKIRNELSKCVPLHSTRDSQDDDWRDDGYDAD